MSDNSSALYTDIQTVGQDVQFTGKLAEMAVNQDWVEGFESAHDRTKKGNDFTTLWTAISSGAEDIGRDFYAKIRNYIDDVGNIDTCGLKSLRNYAEVLGTKSEYLDINISFPIEIQRLVEIFSINTAYLFNKADGVCEDCWEDELRTNRKADYDEFHSISDTLPNTVLGRLTVERFAETLKDKAKFREFVNTAFYDTLVSFLRMKTTAYDDTANNVTYTEIWKTDIGRFMHNLWEDDIDSDSRVFELKKTLGVSKSFTEKIYADDIIAGRRKLSDFTDIQQSVINAEVESRRTRYGTANSMRYYYMRLYKVLEYFRFATIAYQKAYELQTYDLNKNLYSVLTEGDSPKSLLKFNYETYELDTDAVRKVAEWLTDYCINISYIRTQMKSQCQRNMMVGTKRLIVDLIRQFVIDKIDYRDWSGFQNAVLLNANLNTNFDVSVIEYADNSEYYNVENDNDAVNFSEERLNPKYWETYDDSENAFTKEQVLDFYNRLVDDGRRFVRNGNDGSDDPSNLYEFLSALFQSGATSNTNSDYYLSSQVYTYISDTEISSTAHKVLSGEPADVLVKYTGDKDIGEQPYLNEKNYFHPSYQLHPYVQAFEEYNDAYTSVMNMVNSFSEDIATSIGRLKERIDTFGNTIRFWYNWNEDFTGYSTNYEKGGADTDSKLNQDSPFNFDALQEFLTSPGDYVNNILAGVNNYYIDQSSGLSILTTDEMRLEIARLQKYYAQIESVANREIYKYGKDVYGNIYILYKETGNRQTLNALGDVWIRLKNHPIAFPLFDVTVSPSKFSETSCLTETDNAKLVQLISEIINRFTRTYGYHHIEPSTNDGDVVVSNLGLSLGTYSGRKSVLAKSNGASADIVLPDYKSEFDIEQSKFVLSYTKNPKLNNFIGQIRQKEVIRVDEADDEQVRGLSSTDYFVDSVTNETIPGGESSTDEIYDGFPIDTANRVGNETGRILETPGNDHFYATFDSTTKGLEIRKVADYGQPDSILFAEYSDESEKDVSKRYYRKDVYGNVHPCSRHTIRIERIYKVGIDALSGQSDASGNVVFGHAAERMADGSFETSMSRYTSSVEASPEQSYVDGSSVYEDFGRYDYYVKFRSLPQKTKVPYSSIILVGGSNPFYLNPNRNLDDRELIPAEIDQSALHGSQYVFTSNIYRDSVEPSYGKKFAIQDCVFHNMTDSRYSDTITQFYKRDNPYVYYYPYTTIDGVPSPDLSSIEGFDAVTGAVTIRSESGDRTYYYRLKEHMTEAGASEPITAKVLNYSSYSATLNVTGAKFTGGIELTPYDLTVYSINLDFESSDGTDNVATYSTFYTNKDQRKFFDMGFSYNQKLLYLTYRNGSDSYMDSGIVVGKLGEKIDSNYNKSLVYYHDNLHNIQYLDPKSVFQNADGGDGDVVFHIGDANAKNGIFSAFGKYNERTRTINVKVYLFTVDNIFSYQFNEFLKYPLYDFGGDDPDGRYSFKLSCTNSRLYVSFTCRTPDGADVFSNALASDRGGVVGSTRFAEISGYCGDCVVTVLSFNIEHSDSVFKEDDETRYLMQSGQIGRISQYAGLVGKNNVFQNEQISGNSSFTFSPQFHELTGDMNVTFTDIYQAAFPDGDSSIRYFDKFVNVSDNGSGSESITGFLINGGNGSAYVTTLSSGRIGSCVEFENYSDRNGNRYGIYDVSRGIGNGIHLIADGSDSDSMVGSVTFGTDGGLERRILPIYSDIEGYVNADFSSIHDLSDGGLLVFHGNGRTVSNVRLKSRFDVFASERAKDGIYEMRDGAWTYSRLDSDYVSALDVRDLGHMEYEFGMLGEAGFSSFGVSGIGDGKEGYSFAISSAEVLSANFDESCAVSGVYGLNGGGYVTVSDIASVDGQQPRIPSTGYRCPSLTNSMKCGVLRNDGEDGVSTMYFFDAFGEGKTVQCQKPIISYYGIDYPPVPFTVRNEPYFLYATAVRYDFLNGLDYVLYTVAKVMRLKNGTYVPTDCMHEGRTLQIRIEPHDSPVERVLDTLEADEVKLLYTKNGRILIFDAIGEKFNPSWDSDGFYSRTFTFGSVSSDVDLNAIETTMGESQNYLYASYYSLVDGKSGMVRVRKNVADSVGDRVTFLDDHGEPTEISRITEIVSFNDIVLADENSGDRLYISTDGGETFRLEPSSVDFGLELNGVCTNGFVGRYSNGENVISQDGLNWRMLKELPFSKWIAVNSFGKDYAACISVDGDIESGLIDEMRYVDVRQQFTLSGDFDFDDICVSNDGKCVIAYSGSDGSHPFRMGRSFYEDGRYSDFEYFDFKYARGIRYGRGIEENGNFVLAPNGGFNVMKIRDAFVRGHVPTVEYIDISECLNGELNIFKGFVRINGNVILVPSEGDRILLYDDSVSRFYNYMSFDDAKRIVDFDSFSIDGSTEGILTPLNSDTDGLVSFLVTRFSERMDYAVVEIDDGFPIIVTYSKLNTKFDSDDKNRHEVYQVNFTMLNDENCKTVSILTYPKEKDVSSETVRRKTEQVCAYSVGSRTVVYYFSAVDSSPSYRIDRRSNFENSADADGNFLTVDFDLPTEHAKSNVRFAYEYNGERNGAYSVYGGFGQDGYGDILP